jgi:hypothetical protein
VIKPLNARDPDWAEADDDVADGQASPSTIDAAGRTRYRMPTATELGWSVLHIDLAA